MALTKKLASALTELTVPEHDDLVYMLTNGGAHRKVQLGTTRQAVHLMDYAGGLSIGDGVTDASAAFIAARTAAGTGGTVMVPAGTFLFASAIDPGDYITWLGVGRGSILKCAAANTDDAIFKTTGTGAGVLRFEKLAFRSANADCIAVDIDTGVWSTYLNQCTFLSCDFYAEMKIGVSGAMGQCRFEDCEFGLGTPSASYTAINNVSNGVIQSINTAFVNCYFHACTGGTAAVVVGYANTQRFNNCVFETMDVPILDATGAADVVFDNCSIEDIEPGGTYNCVCNAKYDAVSGQSTQIHFRHTRFTNGGTTPWSAIVYCSSSGCNASFEECTGGLSQSFFTLDASGNYDSAQTGAGGLKRAVGNDLTQYAGTLEYDYHREATPFREASGAEVQGNLEVFSEDSLGTESLTNGALTAGTSWTAANDCTLAADKATWAYSGGAASTLTQASGTLAVAGVAGAWYKLVYTVTGATLSATYGYGRLQLTTAFAAEADYLPAINGTHVHYFKAAASPGDFVLTATLLEDQGFSVDSLSLKQCVDGDLYVADDATIVGTSTVGKIVLGSSTVSAAGPTDNVSVTGVSVVLVNTTGNSVTIGGFAGGVSGQVLHVVKNVTANNATLEHIEGGGSQDIYLLSGADETLTGVRGGWTLVCDGTSWIAVGK